MSLGSMKNSAAAEPGVPDGASPDFDRGLISGRDGVAGGAAPGVGIGDGPLYRPQVILRVRLPALLLLSLWLSPDSAAVNAGSSRRVRYVWNDLGRGLLPSDGVAAGGRSFPEAEFPPLLRRLVDTTICESAEDDASEVRWLAYCM